MMKLCKDCTIEKSIDDFECTTKDGKSRRGVCRPCYNKKKADRAKESNGKLDKSSIPKPVACSMCKLGPDECEYTWRIDLKKGGWRPECNKCLHTKGYTDKYRKKCRDTNEEGYLKRNADTHLKWAHNNQEKVQEQQEKTKCEPDRKMKTIVSYVKQKKGVQDIGEFIAFDDEENMKTKMKCACHYCGYVPKDGTHLNGLDKVDPKGIYNSDNTVPCCGLCNSMKFIFTIHEFIEGVREIVKFRGDQHKTDIKPLAFGGNESRRNSKKTKLDNLTNEDKLTLWSSECYLCKKQPALGIDRLDSSKDYDIDNCKSCCTTCNYMKKDLSEVEFLSHIVQIDEHTKNWVIGDTRNMLSIISGVRKPVAAIDDNGNTIIIFPSINCARTLMKCGNSSIQYAIENSSIFRRYRWEGVKISKLKKQRLNYDTCRSILEELQVK